jgi:uncharacterized phosphosugar-binding protein
MDAAMTRTATAEHYLEQLTARMAKSFEQNAEAIAAAADAIEKTAKADGLVYLFGTGHSHILAEEVHYRAGGLALTVPMLATATMLHEGSLASSAYERIPGVAAVIFDRYPIGPKDVLVVISNSGVNAAPIEAVKLGKERGATVIALTSDTYSKEAAKGRPRIGELADILLDNGAPSGDAIIELPGSAQRVGPVSTSIGAALLHAILVEVSARLIAGGGTAQVYLSANMPGSAEVNAGIIKRYRSRNPHL